MKSPGGVLDMLEVARPGVGVPPRAYLTRLRMEKACELLEQTDLFVTEIAYAV
jgi:AraC family transcriptional regulator